MASPADRLLEPVEALVREVEREVIRPRFDALHADEVRWKTPGEVVTVADVEAEARLAEGLRALLPGTPVVGEEACATDPGLPGALRSERAWLVDPLDGTANFVAGGADWAVMVALVESGRTVASWIWAPLHGAMYVARLGAGATRNGAALAAAPAPTDPRQMRGAVLSRFLDAHTSDRVAANRGRFAGVTAGRQCAGVDYPAVVEGAQQFVLYWRTLPWDHAPGTLLLHEAGGRAARPDGSGYHPAGAGCGLLATADREIWDTVRDTLLGGPDQELSDHP